MKLRVFSLGLDQKILKPESAVALRALEYSRHVEQYTVVVPSAYREHVILNRTVDAWGSGGTGKIAQLWQLYRLAQTVLKSGSYSLVTVQDTAFVAWVGLLLARQSGLPLEIQVHGFERLTPLRRILARWILPQAEGVRTVSLRLADALVRDFKVQRTRISVISIYHQLQALPELPPKTNRPLTFITVGRLVPVKRIESQLEALALIGSRLPEARLRIVGDGPERAFLEARTRQLGLDSRVTFFGWRDDVGNLLSEADIFLLTSEQEGWGVAAVEAAQYGLPIIMTDVGCAGELIKTGEHGIVVPVGDSEELAAAMLRLGSDQTLREAYGRQAQAAVRALPNQEQAAGLIAEAWKRIVQK